MYQSSRGSNGRRVLRIRPLATGHERELRPKLDYNARWSSDSRWIEVQGTDSTTNGAWRVDPLTGVAALVRAGKPLPVFRPPLPEGDSGPGSPTPSPDGSVIARAVRGYPKGYNSLSLVPPSGGPPRELVRLKQPEGFIRELSLGRPTENRSTLRAAPKATANSCGFRCGRCYRIARPQNVHDPQFDNSSRWESTSPSLAGNPTTWNCGPWNGSS